MTREEIDAILNSKPAIPKMSKEEIDSILGIQQNSDVSSPKTPKKEVPKVQKVEKTQEKVPFVGNTHASMDSLNKQITESINTNKLHKKQREDEKINSRLSANELRDKQRAEQAQVQAAKVREHALAADKEKSEKNFTLSNDMIGRGGIRDGMTRKDIEALQQAKSIYQMEQDIASTENSIKKQNESLNPFAQKPLIYDIANGIRNNGIVKKEKEISQIKSDLAQGINTPEEHMEVWIKPEYKLSKSEEKKAEKIVSDYDKYMLTKPNISLYPEEFTEEEREYDKKVGHLRSKVYGSQAVQTGYLETMPFYESSLADSEDYQKDKDNIMTQNPAGYYGGMVVGELLKYGLGSKAMQAIPAVGKLTGSAGKGVAKLVGGGDKLAQSAANVMGDTMLDVALDTVPSAVRDAKNGVEGSKVATNALKNLGLNMAFNVGGELLGAGLDSIGKRKVPKQTNADTIPVLNDLETPVIESNVKSALNNSNTIETPNAQAVDNISINNTNDFMKQVNDSVTGKIKPQQAIIVGNTPNKLKEYGASDLKMTMSQSDIAKIAYPKGYMGGKHNLGFYAIEQIPNQLENPLAILKSSTQKNSLIVVTELIDESGYPAIIPIYLSKNGNIGLSNEVASMYGKGNWDKWIENQRKTGKLLFENKERALSELPRTGLQLSGLVAQSDPIFNYSVPKTAQNVNKSANPILDNAEYDVLEDIVKNSATPTVDYRKVKIDGMDDYNKEIDKMVGMYGTNTTKQLAVDLKESLNEVIKTNSEDAWEKFMKNVGEFNDSMKGRSYTYKRKGPKMQAHYENNANEIFLSYVDDIAERARKATANTTVPNSSQQVKTMAAEIEKPINPLNTPKQNQLANNNIPVPGNNAKPYTYQPDELEFAKNRYSNESIVNKSDMPESLTNEFRENPQFYEKIKNSTTSTQADEIMANTDMNGAYSKYLDLLGDKDPVAVPLGYRLAKKYAESGSTDQAIDVIERMSSQLTKSGQFTQAAAIDLLKNDPMSSMRYMKRQIDKLNKSGREKFKDWTNLKLTDEEIEAFGKIDSGDKEAIENLYKSISDRLAKVYPSTKWEKIVEASKTAMMLNPRTHIRNMVANAIMSPVRSVSDRVSALGQNVAHLINPNVKVTQSMVGGNSTQKKIADEIFDNQIKPLLENSNKWEDAGNNIIKNRQVFKDSAVGKLGKKVSVGGLNLVNNVTGGRMQKFVDTVDKSMTGSVMENLRKFDYWLLGEVEDNPFVKSNFSNRLASYMKAQKITSIDAVPEEAIQMAYQEALKATFKDDNALTKAFMGSKKATGVFGEIALPFVKTPANLAMRGIDYSPIGVVNAIRQAKKGTDVGQVIDTLAKSATGTAGIYIGYKLAENGLIQGALSSDSDRQQFEKQQGKVAFSVKVGDHYYSFDWAQPAAIPLIIGSTIYDSIKQDDAELSDILNTTGQAMLAATDAWAGLSPLSSLQDIFGGGTYGSDSMAENVFNEIVEFPQRLIPSLSGAVARTVDPTMRQTYSKGNWFQTQIDTAKSKIPGLSKSLPASYDTWGNERKRQDSTASAAFANFANPGTLGYNASTPIDGEIERLFDETQSNSVFPNKASWSVKDSSGNTKQLSNKEYSEYQKVMGQYSYKMAETLINSDYYNNLDDSSKAESLSELYSIAKSIASNELFGTPISQKNAKKVSIYDTKGAQGLLDYSDIQVNADADGNGNLKKDELIPYLDSKYKKTEEKKYWFGLLSTAKNPY